MAKKILLIASGPIVIGQGMEFDYAASEAIAAYQDAGYEVHAINSNPASLILDLADKAFIYPLDVFHINLLLKENDYCGIAHSFGGQTALNLAMDLSKDERFRQFKVPFLGSSIEAIERAENRESFKELVESLSYNLPSSWIVHQDGNFPKNLRYPLILRPAYTLGGQGGGKVLDEASLKEKLPQALQASPISQCLLEEDLSGQSELEFEVLVDAYGNSECVLSIENIDPVGIHTGDSMVVAPIQSLSAEKLESLEKLAKDIAKNAGVVGACNVQIAYDRSSDRVSVIEMNPRVSRSSALASKITHYPIAYVAAYLSLGYRLGEIKHPLLKDETTMKANKQYPAFKAPLWPFEVIQDAQRDLGTQMKSLGEALGVSNHLEGAIFQVYQAYPQHDFSRDDNATLLKALSKASDLRFLIIMELLKRGVAIETIAEKTSILPYFLRKMKASLSFSLEDFYFASSDQSGRMIPMNWKIIPEKEESNKTRLLFIAPGPCKIGQGIEFDYALMKAVLHAQKRGYECYILNNNPASISTDARLADKVFMAAITLENVDRIAEMYPFDHLVLQFGGQTALDMMEALEKKSYSILGSDFKSTDSAESRERFSQILEEEAFPRVQSQYIYSQEEALEISDAISFPIILRPSYVLAGKDMEVLHTRKAYLEKIQEVKRYPFLIETYIEGKEYDFDAVFDGEKLYHVGIVEHIEASGVHSGDSSLLYPSISLSDEEIKTMEAMALRLAKRLKIKGFMNLQMIVQKQRIYIIELNPRASRTLPFLDRASKQSLIEKGMDVLLDEPGQEKLKRRSQGYALKLSSFSFDRLKGVDLQLGPSMKSTGEWMLQAESLDALFDKAFQAQGLDARSQKIFIHLDDPEAFKIEQKRWDALGYEVDGILENQVSHAELPLAMRKLSQHEYFFVYIEGEKMKTLRRYAYDQNQKLFYRKETMDILYEVMEKKVKACK